MVFKVQTDGLYRYGRHKYIYYMRESDEEVFVSGEKELSFETLQFIPMNSALRGPSKLVKRSQQDVSWKFKALSHSPHPAATAHLKYTRNISFEDEKHHSHSSSDCQDLDEQQESGFVSHYRGCEQVYRKRMGFGTNWIGRRQYFSSTFIDTRRLQKNNIQYYSPKSPFTDQDSLPPPNECTFDSEFQSGNLLCAYKVGELEYDLLLQNDINTKGNTQWFYFRIRGIPRNRPVKINIVNLRKPDSLFNYGLMPCIYSIQEGRRAGRGWGRGGRNISYYKNDHPIQNSKRYYFTLSFTVTTAYQKDSLLIAHSYPYTPTDLTAYLQGIERVKYKRELMERQTIISTIGRNKVEALTIKQANSIKDGNAKTKTRPLIIVMARQHPGQTPSSFVCQGLIDFLLSKDKEGEYLRRNYEIKVLPMVNPDGVAAGNYRTNLAGIDLNRRWDGGNRSKNLHEASYIKKYLAQVAKNRDVAFVIDLHGHSRKLYSFFYGNPSSSPVDCRIFPLLCSRLGPNMVRFEDSTFTSQEFKRNTARVQLGLSLKTCNVFTYEVSFLGYMGKDKEKKHFTVQGLRELGMILGRGMFMHERGRELQESTPDSKEIALYRKCMGELRSNKLLISMGERVNSGSESSPEECEIKEGEEQRLEESEQYNCSRSPPKVKIVKKLLKKEPQVKEVAKSSRQMQVLDIAQVNSAFPTNIMALIPSSYLNKFKKISTTTTTTTTEVQTLDSPLIRIYQTCKQQEYIPINPETPLHASTAESAPNTSIETRNNHNNHNNLRSSILARPKTTDLDYDGVEYTPLSMRSQRKSRDSHRRDKSGGLRPMGRGSVSQARGSVGQAQGRVQRMDQGSQTIVSFGRSSLSTLSNLRVRLEKEISILESKSVDPKFSTLQYHQKGIDVMAVGKTLSKSIYEHLKTRRKHEI